ncbi:MAG TPA: polyribonucleotide nucleotidyltransferase [Longimicrobium sp.]|jgi:polyribonucleotide nucleotidyltransferase|uniref:polyribonucleotide nucleotidyltransferase n=1 Tax=Longimicrobium sp. TaxID=2029185 RepID=UPI002ED8C8C1
MAKLERQFAGRPLIIETGKMARQADGSCTVQFGETMVLCTAVAQDKPTHLPFFPLTIEYRERTYAAGKIPGGFIKREGRPSDKEILSARLIDRPLRPLFPEGFYNETQVFIYVISADQENDADVVALTGASLALNMSRIPFAEPVAAVRIGRIQGQWVLNPTFAQLEYSDLDVIVAGSEDAIQMVEGGALEVPEEEIAEGLVVAHAAIKELIGIQKEVLAAMEVPAKMEWTPRAVDAAIRERVESAAGDRVSEALKVPGKHERADALKAIRTEISAALAEEFPDSDKDVGDVLKDLEKRGTREMILGTGTRSDGRGLDEVRQISVDVGVLPRAHGSALFTRGQTQALGVATLGTQGDEQAYDTVDFATQQKKSFMLHYNFPPFSTGEVKPVRGTSRREIGHGALAERALEAMLPPFDEFPYTIRVVSDVLESNGSSSMASVCAASLSLMDAGVPMRAAVAGVAMGLIAEGDRVAVLTDILGSEDALGDMDFKVAGTRDGVTSIQMDIKIEGLTIELMREALQKANRARMHILDEMEKVLNAPRTELSQYAPRIITIKIDPAKIGEIIGPKGKTIRGIQEATGATINIDDDGTITIASVSGEGGERARRIIAGMTEEAEVGRIYEGQVKSTTTFGAFVEIMPGTEGLLHISELQAGRVEKTEDVVKKGDMVQVKLLSIDEKGRLRLSRKAALAELATGDGASGASATGAPAPGGAA